jgi:hypothetical protein
MDLNPHVTFTNRRETCPSVYIEPLPQAEDVKYLGLHSDRCLTWHKHIFTKRKHLGTLLTKLFWLLGPKSKLHLNNKLLIYKVAIEHLDIWHPIMQHGLQLEHRNYGTLSIESPASNNWCTMVYPKCRYSEWPTDPSHQRRNYLPQLQVQHWTKHASQSSSNSTLESTCHPSALQIHWNHIDSNHSI